MEPKGLSGGQPHLHTKVGSSDDGYFTVWCRESLLRYSSLDDSSDTPILAK